MNELPDLSPKIQVGLFNVLEERDIQIRGFTVRLPLDLCMVFSANPEDYTNRGRIVTPLKDRIGSVVRTHYPLSRELGVKISDETAWTNRGGEVPVVVPAFLKHVVEETSRLARTSPHVNQASGVSVRMSIANLETVISNAERRSLLHGESPVVARVSDLVHIAASSRGKIELSMSEDTGDEDRLVQRLIGEAVKTVFDEYFKAKQFREVVEYFETGDSLLTGDSVKSVDLVSRLSGIPGLVDQLTQAIQTIEVEEAEAANESLRTPLLASMAEFVLEALHCHNRLNKQSTESATRYGY